MPGISYYNNLLPPSSVHTHLYVICYHSSSNRKSRRCRLKSATFNRVRTHTVLILLHVQLVCHGSRRFGLYRRLLVLCKRCYRRCVVPQIHLVAYVCACVRKAMKASLVLPMVLTIAIKATLAQHVSDNSKRRRTQPYNNRIESARDTSKMKSSG